jgi:hypothetical protein
LRQIVAGHVLPVVATGVEDRAAGKNSFQAEDPASSRSVLARARAGRVLGYVAPQHAAIVTCRIRRIEEADVLEMALQVPSDDTRLRLHKQIGGVDPTNAIEPFEGENPATFDR